MVFCLAAGLLITIIKHEAIACNQQMPKLLSANIL